MSIVSYDEQSWIIRDQRIFIISAAIHYFRLPRQEWAEVLDKAKTAGCNCVETYIPWNWHEEREGEWDFSGDKDLEAFLTMCEERELYAIVRPGPYICAEWDFGGLPWWLSAKPDMKYRCDHEPYLHYVDLYLDQIVPRIARHLITRGGTVIMVQVENEFQAWGIPDQRYMEHLRDGMIRRGIAEVPLVTCYGAVDGAVEWRNFWSNPEKHAEVLDQRFSGQPKGILEFWIGWFEQWGGNGANQKSASRVERMSYDVLREGFTAVNYYMFFGGTNFGHWGGRTMGEQTYMTTTYDYDAPLDEYLRPTDKYRALQRVHAFIRWTEDILTERTALQARPMEGRSLQAKTVVSAAGAVTFVANEGQERFTGNYSLKESGGVRVPMTIEAQMALPVVTGRRLGAFGPQAREVVLDGLTAYTLGEREDGLLLYHEARQRSGLCLHVAGLNTADEVRRHVRIEAPGTCRPTVREDGRIVFDLFHGAVPARITVTVDGGEPLRIVVADRAAAERRLAAAADDARGATTVRGAAGEDAAGSMPAGTIAAADALQAPALANWQRADEDWTAAPGGVKHEQPLDFSAFGQFSGHLVYEAVIDVPQAGNRTVVFPRLEDPARVYLNGAFAGRLADIGAEAIRLPLAAGPNQLSVLVQNMGRFNYSQAMGEPKGLCGTPALDGEAVDLLDGWQVEAAGRTHSLKAIPPLEGRIGFLRRFDNDKSYDRAVLVGYGLSRMKINGRRPDVSMETVNAWNRHQATFGVADVSELIQPGNNELEIDVNNVSSISRMTLYLYHSDKIITPWTTKPAAVPEHPKEWHPIELSNVSNSTINDGRPVWYKAEFTCDPQQYIAAGAKLKAYLGGLGKGACWINGFCIGRFWQIGPQEFYKIPVSLLREHNEILIYDEEGSLPDQVILHFH